MRVHPAGQDEYFMRIGDVVAGKDAPPPQLSERELAERRCRAAELASTYRSGFLWLAGPATVCRGQTRPDLGDRQARRWQDNVRMVDELPPTGRAYETVSAGGGAVIRWSRG
ncbi:hypothetical protein [Streptomyces sp. NBC_00986]|uniref:hypothetical protein n=1 Tax=Streptomyces sp. NBC_00986 TaxID=2903702 RepID=UPI00386E0D21|nr:hypothetical protein OG504_01980 [Streptomyces sp. NBC_00986]